MRASKQLSDATMTWPEHKPFICYFVFKAIPAATHLGSSAGGSWSGCTWPTACTRALSTESGRGLFRKGHGGACPSRAALLFSCTLQRSTWPSKACKRVGCSGRQLGGRQLGGGDLKVSCNTQELSQDFRKNTKHLRTVATLKKDRLQRKGE